MTTEPITTAAQARAYLEGSLPNSGLSLPCFICDAAAGQPCDPDCPDLNDLQDAVLDDDVEDDYWVEMLADCREGR